MDSTSARFAKLRQVAQPFTFDQKLFPEKSDARDGFGSDLEVREETAVIGAPGDEDPNGDESGSVYVFKRRNGEWSEQEKLVPEGGSADERFGSVVALSGDILVGGTEDAGVYVFEQDGNKWTEQQRLTANDTEDDDQFGSAVAVAGETIVVGAPLDQNRNGDDVGSAYVFERQNNEWAQHQQLVPTDGDDGDRFGSATAISTDTIVITARSDWDPNGDNAGSAYVFERNNGEWSQQQKLAADDGDQNDQFGASVSLTDDTAVVGTPSDDEPNGNTAGSAYVFGRTGDRWAQQQKLAADDGDERDQFGNAVSLHGNTIAVGAIADENPNGSESGSVYVFQRDEATWNQQQKVTPNGADARDRAGIPVLSADDLLIGAPFDEDPNGNSAGSVYAFARETNDEGAGTPTPSPPETTPPTASTETPESTVTRASSPSPAIITTTSESTTAESSTTSSAVTTTAPTESTTTVAPTTTEPPETTTTTGQSGFSLVAVGAAVVLAVRRLKNRT